MSQTLGLLPSRRRDKRIIGALLFCPGCFACYQPVLLFLLAARVNNSVLTNTKMKKGTFSILKNQQDRKRVGNRLGLALLGMFLQRKMQAFEKEGRGERKKEDFEIVAQLFSIPLVDLEHRVETVCNA